MSRRRSTGDLVPRDITEILAREARAQRGQKKPGSSLGQAFSWLKGSRKKKNLGNGLNRTGAGATDTKVGLQNHETAKAGPKGNDDQTRLAVHYRTSQYYQENVFIEGSRPQYLEDLHTEAQEGLKILQQEENTNGMNFPDDESVASTDTLRPEQDISSKDGVGSPEPRSTTGSTDTTVTSAVSSRPVLTRQGSTFKPLNPVKRLDKSRKRSRRTTIMGIPNQVQKELALHRSSTFQQLVSTPNHDREISDSQSGVVIIPTVDGGTPVVNKEGARVHLSELEASKDEQLLKKHLEAMNQDEQPFNHQSFGSYFCPTSNLRPKSLAVPGMTTSSSSCASAMFNFLQEPQGPVMSISPQATYLSTIIPNAVLPASVEVIEIDRGSSRTRGNSVNHGGSVRTVSKNSLASGDLSVSPLLSRRSAGDGSQTDNSQNDSTLMSTSASGSNWSESQSSKTISNSPVSSKGSTRSGNSQRAGLNRRESQTEQSIGDQDLISLHSSVSMISSSSSKRDIVVTGQGPESDISESVAAVDDPKTKQNFTRSLSVMKTKQPPAPPRRTNSLHSSKIRSNSSVLVDLNDSVSGEVANATENILVKNVIKSVTADTSNIPAPVSNSTESSCLDGASTQASSTEAGGATQPRPESSSSSPQKTSSEGGKFERTMSPSSGYSSQSGTPTLSPKGISPASPDKQKKPVKPERSMSLASSAAASPSSSLTSLSSATSEPVNPDVSTCSSILPPQGSPPTLAAKQRTPNHVFSNLGAEVRELLNIPPPPKVKAPCPPPPETWAHNRRTFQLLCEPCPNVSKVPQKQAQRQENTVKQAGTQTEASKEMHILDQKQSTINKSVPQLSESKAKPKTLSSDPEGVHNEMENRECPGTEQERVSADVQKQDQSSSPVVKDPESPKKDPPPVMKKPMTVLHREEVVSTEHLVDQQKNEMSSSVMTDVDLLVENHTTSSQQGVIILVEKLMSDSEMENEVTSMQTLIAEVPKISKASPPPTPPPAYHPTPPPSRKTPPSSVSIPPEELQRVQEEIHVVESSWPPPPPPMEGDSVFDGGDEVDFPPPPPPFVAESVLNVMDSCITELDVSKIPTEEIGETIEDSSEAKTSVHVQTADLPPAVPQTTIESKQEVILQVSKVNTTDEISCRPEQNVSVLDNVPPPPTEVTPLPPIISESSVSTSASAPPSNFLKRDSLKIEDQTPAKPPVNAQPPITVPVAPPLPAENLTHGVNFRRQPSVQNRDAKGKELLSRHKSVPIPKEDANIPLVTPSLLQMVRLRSVNMTEDQVKAPSEDKSGNQEASVQENCPISIPGPQNIPQKPIRKSLTQKLPPQTVKTSSLALNTPSMRLQEAIRMKTAAMSSRDGLPSRLGVRSTYSFVGEQGALSLKSPEACDMHKSPASTASFIFSRSTKKVVIETAASSSPDAQAILKQSLAAELMQVSDQSKTSAFSNGGMKSDKVPPPVAKKPSHGSNSPLQNLPACSAKMDFGVEGNGVKGGITLPETTTTRVTADTIETLF
ncbi:uncharacterized protein KIAA1522 homolog isoform X2 [Plectropomus leopardus]|uniref:uncharacterized protein KIAA1522 homolog isoform X2 n=1 Tax=Plectropomus leopardus TaxID=160734 RepID=UPI001C4D179B|nr:uncharacterized protein KIAA1522 homolog isoform X2 [Plectropomus leopardus]